VTPPPFARSEYLARIAATKIRMAEQGIDVALICAPENIYYLSGYAGWSFYTPQMLVLALDEEEPILVLREMDVACATLTAFLDRSNVIGYPESYIGNDDRHPMHFIADTIVGKCWATRSLGIEMDAHFFSPRSYHELVGRLGGARVQDLGLLVNWVRIVKSPREIDYTRQAGEISAIAMQAGIDAIRPGVRECDVAADIYRAKIRGTAAFGGGVSTGIAMPSGAKTSAPHLYWSDDVIAANTSTNIEFGGCRHQYHAGLSRSIYLGTPPRAMSDLADVVVEGLDTALASVRAGVVCEDVEAAWRTVINRAGYEKSSRIGYSIGLAFQPSWVERTASLQQGDRTELVPDMTFHMICGMWSGDHNIVISETFRVTEQGHDLLTHFPRRLFVKD